MNESMKLDISKIEFEEAYDNAPFEEYTLYFISPRDLVKDKYPEAEHSTISLELTTRTTMISPTKNGMDYDWSDIKLDNDTIDRLITLYVLHKNRTAKFQEEKNAERKEIKENERKTKMGKRGRPLKDNKRDDSYRFRLNTEERQMLTQLSEWTEQPIAAVIRAALHIYYETIESERNIQFDNLEEKKC